MLSEEEILLLGRSVEGVLAPDSQPGKAVGGYTAQDPATWAGLAELGVLGAPFAEEFGGLGLGIRELGAIMKSLGRATSVEPYLSTVVLSGGLLARSGDCSLKAELLPQVSSGALRIGLALVEPGVRYNYADVATRAVPAEAGYRLSGHKSLVLDAPDADKLIVLARLSPEGAERPELCLFLLDREAPGLVLQDYFLIDGRRAADLFLTDVPVDSTHRMEFATGTEAALGEALGEATLALCWEAVGAMERLNELTLEHCKDRIVFGQPLSKLQVVQHRLVDMQVAFEHARAITEAATWRAGDESADAALQVAAAKATVAQEGMFIAEAAVQLHGAAGTTEDLDIGRLFKRIITNKAMLGDRDFHLRRYLDLYLGASEKHG